MVGKSPANIVVKGHIYHFRKAVPSDLKQVLGKGEYCLSLRTSYLREARAKAMRLAAVMDHLFSTLRRRGGRMTLDAAKIREIADKYIQDHLELYHRDRVDRERPFTEDELETHLEVLLFQGSDRFEELQNHNFKGISKTVDNVLDEHGVKVDRDSEVYRDLCHALLRADVKWMRIEMDRAQGKYDDEYALPLTPQTPQAPAATPDVPSSGQNGRSVPLSQVLEDYIRDRTGEGKWTTKTQETTPQHLRLFIEIVGDKPSLELTIDDVRRYKETMRALPKNKNKLPKYKGKTIAMLMKMQIPKEHLLGNVTLENQFTNIRSFLNWAYDWDYITTRKIKAPLSTKKKNTGESTRASFTIEELQNLFHGKEYKQDLHKYGWQYWIPILGLYTGARIEEISQLLLDDVKEVDGIWCLDINDTGTKNVKTESGRRLVPLHPFIVEELRLPEYVERLKKSGEERLFADLKYTKKGKCSDKASKWFGRYRESCGIVESEEGKKLVFHSFRNTLISTCYEKEVDIKLLKQMVGHKSDDITDKYAGKQSAELIFKRVVMSLDFHELVDMEHLKRSKHAGKRP